MTRGMILWQKNGFFGFILFLVFLNLYFLYMCLLDFCCFARLEKNCLR